MKGFGRGVHGVAFNLAFVTACITRPSTPIQAMQTPSAPVIPFVASTLDNTFFAVVGEFHGKVIVTSDSILIEVDSGLVRLRPVSTGYNGPRVLGNIRVGVATE